MKYVTQTRYMDGRVEPWYVGKDIIGGRMVDRFWLRSGGQLPWYLAYAYSDATMRAEVWYPFPLNLAIAFWGWVLWYLLRSFYWIGLIDVEAGERFSWSSFWRIKSKC